MTKTTNKAAKFTQEQQKARRSAKKAVERVKRLIPETAATRAMAILCIATTDGQPALHLHTKLTIMAKVSKRPLDVSEAIESYVAVSEGSANGSVSDDDLMKAVDSLDEKVNQWVLHSLKKLDVALAGLIQADRFIKNFLNVANAEDFYPSLSWAYTNTLWAMARMPDSIEKDIEDFGIVAQDLCSAWFEGYLK